MYLLSLHLLLIPTALSLKAASINSSATFPFLTTTNQTQVSLPSSILFDYECIGGQGPLVFRDHCVEAINLLPLISPRGAPPMVYSPTSADPNYKTPMRFTHESCAAIIMLNIGAVHGFARPRDLKLFMLGLNQVCNSQRFGFGLGGAASVGEQGRLIIGLRNTDSEDGVSTA